MDRNAARALLTAVRGGTVDVEAALERLGGVGDLGYARVDLDRARRTGVPEVVFGPGKSPDQIAGVLRTLREAGQPGLVTRIAGETAAEVIRLLGPGDHVWHATARVLET